MSSSALSALPMGSSQANFCPRSAVIYLLIYDLPYLMTAPGSLISKSIPEKYRQDLPVTTQVSIHASDDAYFSDTLYP
ncbi:MAG: hypothetical protein KAR15_07365 [Desulfobacterales bacterium]|nr:hypothetical protein [Desulfobacterales bacterium]